MGSTAGSVLQTIGQTGNEVATGDINATNQAHQFTMDYLANQARSRGLDIQQSLGQQQVDIEKQRLNQSRWTLMPGYSKIPDPNNPGSSLYRHTFMDPITNQRSYYDADQPPPGSPEYNMNSFKTISKEMKDAGIDLPIDTRLSIAGMKVDNPSDVNQKWQVLWDQMQKVAKNDPAAQAYINKNYSGGFVEYLDKNVQGTESGLSKKEFTDYIIKNGLTTTGQVPNSQMDKVYEDSLTQAQKVYGAQLTNANKQLTGMSLQGYPFNHDAYKAALEARDTAQQNLNDVNDKLTTFRARISPSPAAAPAPAPSFTNPPVTHAATIDAAAASKLGATKVAPDANGNWYWVDDAGNIKGAAPPNGGQ